jgi:hypothetical protein
VSTPPAAVAANMFRREIGFETTLMMLSLRWRRHDAPRFSLFGKRLTLAIPYGHSTLLMNSDALAARLQGHGFVRSGPPSRARLMNEEFGTARNW